MDNKQNQPNSGTSSSSSSSAANKPAAQQPTTPESSASASPVGSASTATSSRQPSASSSASSRQPQAKPNASDNTDSQSSQTQDAAPRKSWLDQEQWAKSVDQLPQSLKDFGNKALEQVNSLSTTQKVVGGALLVSGLSWLALRSKSKKSSAVDTSLYTPEGDSKWKASSESVYRGTTSTLRNSDDSFSF